MCPGVSLFDIKITAMCPNLRAACTMLAEAKSLPTSTRLPGAGRVREWV